MHFKVQVWNLWLFVGRNKGSHLLSITNFPFSFIHFSPTSCLIQYVNVFSNVPFNHYRISLFHHHLLLCTGEWKKLIAFRLVRFLTALVLRMILLFSFSMGMRLYIFSLSLDFDYEMTDFWNSVNFLINRFKFWIHRLKIHPSQGKKFQLLNVFFLSMIKVNLYFFT